MGNLAGWKPGTQKGERSSLFRVPVKSHREEPGRTRNTLGTHGIHGRTDHTDEPHNHPNPTTHVTPARPVDHATAETAAEHSTTGQPQARSRPLPAADSEEAAPSEPDPASTRSQIALRAPPCACSKAVGEMKARAALITHLAALGLPSRASSCPRSDPPTATHAARAGDRSVDNILSICHRRARSFASRVDALALRRR